MEADPATFTRDELDGAVRALSSTLGKCEKVLPKLKAGGPQHTLLTRRIDALRIALVLLQRELDARTDSQPDVPDVARGDLFWVTPDAPQAIAHPHVVVQDDVLNRSRLGTVVVCALTSNLQRAGEPGNVLLAEGEGGLPKRSVVVVSQVSAVAKHRLGEKIGALDAERVTEILDGLRFQQASYFANR